jgi:hypothetical protein
MRLEELFKLAIFSEYEIMGLAFGIEHAPGSPAESSP